MNVRRPERCFQGRGVMVSVVLIWQQLPRSKEACGLRGVA